MLTTDKFIPIVDTAKASYSLPQALYCQEDAFTKDMVRVIKQKWLLVDHIKRIPKQRPNAFILWPAQPHYCLQ